MKIVSFEISNPDSMEVKNKIRTSLKCIRNQGQQECVNTQEGYECKCPEGYWGINGEKNVQKREKCYRKFFIFELRRFLHFCFISEI